MILKICGITNQEDATAAIEAGANALGFNFYPRSPRYLAPEEAAAILSPAGVRRVGVFVNQERGRVEEIARTARLDVAQLHGDETPAGYPAAPAPSSPVPCASDAAQALVPTLPRATLTVWKAIRVGDSFDISLYENVPAEALLLDSPAPGLYGGSGRVFDWRLVRRTHRRIVLAGGLDASNVAAAIELLRPWGVDSCSRIESAPGKKDHQKMNQFLQAAKAAAQS